MNYKIIQTSEIQPTPFPSWIALIQFDNGNFMVEECCINEEGMIDSEIVCGGHTKVLDYWEYRIQGCSHSTAMDNVAPKVEAIKEKVEEFDPELFNQWTKKLDQKSRHTTPK